VGVSGVDMVFHDAVPRVRRYPIHPCDKIFGRVPLAVRLVAKVEFKRLFSS
jgi:hypothetical protein